MNKFASVVVFVIFSSASLSYCDNSIPACLINLMPCLPDLQNTNQKPAERCCVPLQRILQTDQQCLCDLINNVQLINNFHLTRQVILNLPQRCGLPYADPKKCGEGDTEPNTPVASSPTPGPIGDSLEVKLRSGAGIGNAVSSLGTILVGGALLLMIF